MEFGGLTSMFSAALLEDSWHPQDSRLISSRVWTMKHLTRQPVPVARLNTNSCSTLSTEIKRVNKNYEYFMDSTVPASFGGAFYRQTWRRFQNSNWGSVKLLKAVVMNMECIVSSICHEVANDSDMTGTILPYSKTCLYVRVWVAVWLALEMHAREDWCVDS